MNLRSIDLNLLTVFDAIVSEGNQTRAAAKLGMSQPAMSNALARLRDALGDQLFVRTSSGMVPTPRARLLIDPVRDALDILRGGIERAKREEDDFDFSSSRRTFVIATGPYGETILVPRLLRWLTRNAPSVQLKVRRETTHDELAKKLNSGTIDLAVQHAQVRDGSIENFQLLEDEFVSLVRQEHPTVGATLDISLYASLLHVVVRASNRVGARASSIDAGLNRLGLERTIAAQVSGFSAMPFIVRDTDCICTLPRRLAQIYAKHYRLRIVRMPLTIAPLPLYLMWSRSLDNDAGHRWFRGLFHELGLQI